MLILHLPLAPHEPPDKSRTSLVGASGILITILIAAGAMAAASWFVFLAEQFATLRFRSGVFRRGIVALSEELDLPHPRGRFAPGETVETASGRFHLLGPNECLFRERIPLFEMGRRNTAFSLKGTIRWLGGRAQVQGRMCTASVVFAAAWIVGAATMGLAMLHFAWEIEAPGVISRLTGIGCGALALLAALVVSVVIVRFSVPSEVARARSLVREFEAVLRASTDEQADAAARSTVART